MLKKKKIYDIVLFVKKITERCPSGLRSWSWKPVMLNGTVGSNPTLSAINLINGEVLKWLKRIPC